MIKAISSSVKQAVLRWSFVFGLIGIVGFGFRLLCQETDRTTMKIRQIVGVVVVNFRQWHKDTRIMVTFCLAFVLCFLLSDNAFIFAKEYRTTMQLVEAFV